MHYKTDATGTQPATPALPSPHSNEITDHIVVTVTWFQRVQFCEHINLLASAAIPRPLETKTRMRSHLEAAINTRDHLAIRNNQLSSGTTAGCMKEKIAVGACNQPLPGSASAASTANKKVGRTLLWRVLYARDEVHTF